MATYYHYFKEQNNRESFIINNNGDNSIYQIVFFLIPNFGDVFTNEIRLLLIFTSLIVGESSALTFTYMWFISTHIISIAFNIQFFFRNLFMLFVLWDLIFS